MVKSRPNMNKMAIILISDGVSALLEKLKEKPNNCGLSYRLDIIATGKLMRSPTTDQYLTKSNFSDILSKTFKIFPVKK